MASLDAITVAGVRIAVADAELPASLASFAASPRGADLRITVRPGRPDVPPEAAGVFEGRDGTLQVSERAGCFRLTVLDAAGAPLRRACFDAVSGAVDLVAPPQILSVDPVGEILLEWLALHRLARSGGFVLPGCVAVREGRALTFVPQSGAPAPAQALRRAAARLLADAAFAVRPSGLGLVASAWPWPTAATVRARGTGALKAIHLLRSADLVVAEPLVGDRARRALAARVRLPAGCPSAVSDVLDAVAAAVQQVPVIRLAAPADERLARYAWGDARPRPRPVSLPPGARG